jgi:hypothetical protein
MTSPEVREAVARVLRPVFADWFDTGYENGRLDPKQLTDQVIAALEASGIRLVREDAAGLGEAWRAVRLAEQEGAEP